MNSISDIQCGEQLTIAQCAEIYAQLLAAMVEGQAVNIDVSQLQRIDSAALQLFYSFQRDARAQGLVTIWSEPSKVFCDAVDILGMGAFYRQNS
ncbi:STAS domain-containing protein [Methylophaga sp.]|jgi:ABC-type transporter Mla MlaB component|uniref:STAS domain-containing protein n=1 Tax=Methylophaga sp. TaxID=2024840 RepID=UPI0013FEED3C|nr:STAS domain-containing protein [Methylophaga sp.]MTI63775.1 STAS domain-containing protein [Methylophaga sp.]